MSASRLQVVGRRGSSAARRGRMEVQDGLGYPAVPPFSMAFQPIVDVAAMCTVGYEALVRGVHGEGASAVLGQVPETERYIFDEACRVVAIEKAALLGLVGMNAMLSINFYPNSVGEAVGDLQQTLRAAESVGLAMSRVVFEISEMERLREPEHLKEVLAAYRREGLRTAIDDFGAGFAGLSMLAAFQPDIVKIDLALTEMIDERRTSRVIVRGIQQICGDLGIEVIAEGVEREAQRDVLRDLGICRMQGNLFAPATFEALPVWAG